MAGTDEIEFVPQRHIKKTATPEGPRGKQVPEAPTHDDDSVFLDCDGFGLRHECDLQCLNAAAQYSSSGDLTRISDLCEFGRSGGSIDPPVRRSGVNAALRFHFLFSPPGIGSMQQRIRPGARRTG